MTDLLPCPFCGGENLRSGGDDKIVGVWCLDCQASGPNHYGRHEWNTRAPGWQPIETAPKDGTVVIGLKWNVPWADGHTKGDIVRCWYQPEFEAFISSCREMSLASGYTFEDGETRHLHSPEVENVSHWMPFRTPPDSGGD